jgi:flagellar assembly protein FliH
VNAGKNDCISLTSLSEGASEDVRARNEYQRAYNEGRETARREMLEEVEAHINAGREQLHTLVESLQTQYATFQKRAEHSAVELAVGMAELILKRELASDREIVLKQIHEALKRVLGVDRIKLRVSPGDEQLVREQRTAIMAESDSVREMVIEADDTISRGGCIVESESGNVDALLSTQLKKIEEALLDDAGISS